MRSQSQLVPGVSRECVLGGHLLRDLPGQSGCDASGDVDLRQFVELRLRLFGQFAPFLARSASSVSDCELTETYSPAAIDMAPATRPAAPATRASLAEFEAAATPTTRLAVEMMPSLAPSTAARSQPNSLDQVALAMKQVRLVRPFGWRLSGLDNDDDNLDRASDDWRH